MKILLIEDNEQISQGLDYFFEKNNFSVIIALSCKAAKEKLKEEYDAIILDVSLPDGNGFDFYQLEIKPKDIFLDFNILFFFFLITILLTLANNSFEEKGLVT